MEFYNHLCQLYVAFSVIMYSLFKILQENGSLVTNFNDQKLLVTIITNLNTSLQSTKIIGY